MNAAKRSNSSDDLLELKRQRRLERNRDSARECRKRKKDRYEFLKSQLLRLEADNLQLRMKLKIGPESIKRENQEIEEMTAYLDSLLKDGSSEDTIKQAIFQIAEKHSDYGRDRRSAVEFHIAALRKSLQPTQTTRTILWLLSCVPQFHNLDGSLIAGKEGLIADLWYSLVDTLQPTPEQSAALARLSATCQFNELEQVAGETDAKIARLETLVANRNESLDSEMRKIQSLMNARQVAKFILWIANNPAVMQMLEALWPHLEVKPRNRAGATNSQSSTSSSEPQAEESSSVPEERLRASSATSGMWSSGPEDMSDGSDSPLSHCEN